MGMRGLALRSAKIALIVLACAYALFPFAYLIGTSLKPPGEFFTRAIFPKHLTWAHYDRIFADPDTTLMLKNSLIVAGTTTVVSVIVGSLAAYGLARLGLKTWVLSLAIFLMLFIRFYPKITTAIPFFVIMRDIHLLDTPWAIVLGHLGITVPFVTWLMLIFFNSLPPELEESAMVEGATPIQRLRYVVLPIATPGLAAAAIFTAFLSWNEFLIASTVTRHEGVVLPVGVASFITDKGILFGPLAALASVVVFPMVVFALLMQRYLVRGLTLGAVKG
jgi:ABC-type glycerol-3-phosphate transport system permease component